MWITNALGAATSYPAGLVPTAVASADFNLDGTNDVAVLGERSFVLLLNRGWYCHP